MLMKAENTACTNGQIAELEQAISLPLIRKGKKSSLSEIAQRANIRKADPNLRHVPTESDVSIASEHAKLMIYHQYQSIDADEEEI